MVDGEIVTLTVRTPLTPEQRAGHACVRCHAVFATTTNAGRVAVAMTGRPARDIYACGDCAPLVRVPQWNEFGAV